MQNAKIELPFGEDSSIPETRPFIKFTFSKCLQEKDNDFYKQYLSYLFNKPNNSSGPVVPVVVRFRINFMFSMNTVKEFTYVP